MKMKVARRVVKAAEKGVFYPLHTLRLAALRVGRPISIRTGQGNLVYFPKELKGEFVEVSSYRPWFTKFLPKTPEVALNMSVASKFYIDGHYYDYVQDLNVPRGTLTYDVSAGSSIGWVAKDVAKLSKNFVAKVTFHFNDMKIVVHPNQTSDEVYDLWSDEQDRLSEEYRNSDQYKIDQAEAAERKREHQEAVDRLLADLPNRLFRGALREQHQDSLMNWVHDFAKNAEFIGLEYDKESLIKQFTDVGYKSSDCCWFGDMTEEEYTELEESNPEMVASLKMVASDKIKRDKNCAARWIIGQVISCLESGMPPHPVTCVFVERYRGDRPWNESRSYEEDESRSYKEEVEEVEEEYYYSDKEMDAPYVPEPKGSY